MSASLIALSDNQVHAVHQAVGGTHHRVTLRHGQRAAGREIVLNVNREQSRLHEVSYISKLNPFFTSRAYFFSLNR